MNNQSTGSFIISLDFELHWGVRDKRSVKVYQDNLLQARNAVVQLLKLFEEYKIHATWATVGLLMFEDKKTLLNEINNIKLEYEKHELSPYININQYVGNNEEEDPYHYANSLIKKIKETKNQEIASHTFSHYYCLEVGQTREDFKQDIMLFNKIVQKNNIEITSIIFPRNQMNENYSDVLLENEIIAYRGNQAHWLYSPKNEKQNTKVIRSMVVADAYINLFGHQCYSIEKIGEDKPYNIAASRFLRPYSKRLRWLEKIKIKRIKKDMEFAAKNKEIYHLWWHPHNFGKNTEKNIENLIEILKQYLILNKQYGFQSKNMSEIGKELDGEKL